MGNDCPVSRVTKKKSLWPATNEEDYLCHTSAHQAKGLSCHQPDKDESHCRTLDTFSEYLHINMLTNLTFQHFSLYCATLRKQPHFSPHAVSELQNCINHNDFLWFICFIKLCYVGCLRTSSELHMDIGCTCHSYSQRGQDHSGRKRKISLSKSGIIKLTE